MDSNLSPKKYCPSAKYPHFFVYLAAIARILFANLRFQLFLLSKQNIQIIPLRLHKKLFRFNV